MKKGIMNSDYLGRVQNPFRMVDKQVKVKEERVVTRLQMHWTLPRKTELSVRAHLKQTPVRKILCSSGICYRLKD